MSNELTQAREKELEGYIEILAKDQIATRDNLEKMLIEMSRSKSDLMQVREKLDKHENLLTKAIPLNGAEKSEIHIRVSEKAAEVATDLGYKSFHGRRIALNRIYPAIWNNLKRKYHVNSYHYLPSAFFPEIKFDIENFRPTKELKASIDDAIMHEVVKRSNKGGNANEA